jgi:hypothetical protein
VVHELDRHRRAEATGRVDLEAVEDEAAGTETFV